MGTFRSVVQLVVLTFVAVACLSVSSVRAETPPPFILKWGTTGSGPGEFNRPHAVIESGGYVYVADRLNQRIQKFDAMGGFVLQWGSPGSGSGQFDTPYDIAALSSSEICVVDRDNHRIQKFSSDGTYLAQWGSFGTGNGEFNLPRGIAVDGSDNIYVADTDNHRIQKFSSDGIYLAQWGSFGTGNGEFAYPIGIVVDQALTVYVCDNNNHRIQKFSSDGTYLAQWGSFGSLGGQLNSPWGIALDQAGNVFVADAGNYRIQKFTSEGSFLTEWGEQGSANGQFNPPIDVCLDQFDNVYVADEINNRIQKFGTGPGLRSVVLLHGYCGSTSMWDDLVGYLESQGFPVYRIALDPPNGHPADLVYHLENMMDVGVLAGKEVDIIAHSMGGLVARWYIKQRGPNCRVKNLVTLGTPHHGVPLAPIGEDNFPFKKWLKEAYDPCLLNDRSLGALSPGSAFLNELNYGSQSANADRESRGSKGSHPVESDYGSGVKVWTIAGTREFADLPAGQFTGVVWGKLLGTPIPFLFQKNDGVVGVDGARMYNSISSNYSDEDLGLSPIQHFGASFLYLGSAREYATASDLFPIIRGMLLGEAPQVEGLNPLRVAGTPTDSVISVVGSGSPTVNMGQMAEAQVSVPGTSIVQFILSADLLPFSFRTPSNNIWTAADTVSVSGLHYAEDQGVGLAAFTVENPTSGTWAIIADATALGSDLEYAFTVIAVTTRETVIETGTPVSYGSDPIQLRVFLEESGVPLPGSSWNVVVTKPDSTTFGIDVYDDGAHGDDAAGDGIFGNTLNLPGPLGFYRIEATGTPPADSVTYIGTRLVELASFHDLLVSSELLVSKNYIEAGDSLIMSARIRNDGVDAVSNLDVEFWDGTSKFGEVTIPSLAAGDSQLVALQWNAAAPDTHNLRITIDPFAQPDETDYVNNTVSREVVLGVPIVGVEITLPAKLQLGPVVPNPFIGSTTIHFATPATGPVTLAAYDVAGRQINKWHWDNLAPGQHVVHWNGTTRDGVKLRPGVVFLRLNLNNQVRTTKTIILR